LAIIRYAECQRNPVGIVGFVRQFLSIRGLLDSLGWKQAVGSFILAILAIVWSHVKHIPAPIAFAMGLAATALAIIVWRALTFGQQRLHAPDDVKPTAGPEGGQVDFEQKYPSDFDGAMPDYSR
jgi:hypothetical protein